MTEHNGLLRIGEFAKLSQSNLRTLRYYEELGLIRPAKRSTGGFRYYHENQLERVEAIRRLKDLGLSLSEVAAALDTVEDDGSTRAERLRGVLERQAELIEQRIGRMKSDLAELDASRVKLLTMCQSCGTPMTPENCDPCPRDGEPLQAALRALL